MPGASCLRNVLALRISLGRRVVELGSGTGYVGLIAAALGHRTTMTVTGLQLINLDRVNTFEDDFFSSAVFAQPTQTAQSQKDHTQLFNRRGCLQGEGAGGSAWGGGRGGSHMIACARRSTCPCGRTPVVVLAV